MPGSKLAGDDDPVDPIANGPHRWTVGETSLLDDWRKRAFAAQSAYFSRATGLGWLNYLLGIPVVVVTTLAGTEIVTKHVNEQPISIWVGVITVSAAVLASLQTFLRFGERAAFSAVAGAKYSVVRRKIERLVVHPPADKDVTETLDALEHELADLGDHSPAIGQRLWLRWARALDLSDPSPKRWLRLPKRLASS